MSIPKLEAILRVLDLNIYIYINSFVLALPPERCMYINKYYISYIPLSSQPERCIIYEHLSSYIVIIFKGFRYVCIGRPFVKN